MYDSELEDSAESSDEDEDDDDEPSTTSSTAEAAPETLVVNHFKNISIADCGLIFFPPFFPAFLLVKKSMFLLEDQVKNYLGFSKT